MWEDCSNPRVLFIVEYTPDSLSGLLDLGFEGSVALEGEPSGSHLLSPHSTAELHAQPRSNNF